MAEDKEKNSTATKILTWSLPFIVLFFIYQYYVGEDDPGGNVIDEIKDEVLHPLDKAMELSIKKTLGEQTPSFFEILRISEKLEFVRSPSVTTEHGVTIAIGLAKSAYGQDKLPDSAYCIKNMRRILGFKNLCQNDDENKSALIWNTIIGITQASLRTNQNYFFDPHLWLQKELVKKCGLNVRDNDNKTALDYATQMLKMEAVNKTVAQQYYDILIEAGAKP